MEQSLNGVIVGDSTKNGKATASLVLGIVGFFLSFLLIPQILGVIFGILGVKSQKRGIAIAGIVISSIDFFIVLPVSAIIAVNMFAGVMNEAQRKADIQHGYIIQQAISAYMISSGDAKLEGLGKSPKEIISSLQNKIEYKGKQYGPYFDKSLTNGKDIYIFNFRKNNGWKIVILKDVLKAQVSPSQDGDKLEFE